MLFFFSLHSPVFVDVDSAQLLLEVTNTMQCYYVLTRAPPHDVHHRIRRNNETEEGGKGGVPHQKKMGVDKVGTTVGATTSNSYDIRY